MTNDEQGILNFNSSLDKNWFNLQNPKTRISARKIWKRPQNTFIVSAKTTTMKSTENERLTKI